MSFSKPSKKDVKRFIIMILGNVILSFSVAVLKFSSFGNDPFNCMTLGVSSILPISYGTFQLLLNLILFIPLYFLRPRILGAGALMNMFLLAYIVEFFTYIAGLFNITVQSISGNLPVRIVLLVAGIITLCYGVALYMEADMGTASYDALSQIIDERSKGKLPFRYVRIVTDIICVVIGFSCGSIVGIGTVVTSLFTGPLVSFFRKRININ